MIKKIWIIIVNYRTAPLTVNCLRSIASQIKAPFEIHALVIDNDSRDGSVDMLCSEIKGNHWENWVSVFPAGRNGGFAFGNNVGISKVLNSSKESCYVMLLNPDTIVRNDAVLKLVEFMDENSDVGIAGSLLENENGEPESSAHTAFSPLGELEAAARLGVLTRLLHRYAVTPEIKSTPHACDWVSGASFIVRREVFETVGLLDDKYFLYFEEADFCLRTRNAGWKIWFVPQSRVCHLEGASTGIKKTHQRRPKYWYESRRRYFVKHFGISGLILCDIFWAVGRISLTLRRTLGLGSGGNRTDPKLYAFDLLWGDTKAMITGQVFRICRNQRSP